MNQGMQILKTKEILSENNNKIPVTILTGFLGSGKTTLLNYILKSNHGKKIAVIETEFGMISVDQEIIQKSREKYENVVEMINVCICCAGDLIETFLQLKKRSKQFDYVIIETTGLADPAPVAKVFMFSKEI